MAHVWHTFPLLIAIGALLWVPVAHAGTFTVTKTTDTKDGICDADCSLREAIIAANSNPDADDVIVPAGTYVLTKGDLEITDQLTLNGAGADTTIIDGNGTDRVIDVLSGTVEISAVTIQNGSGVSPLGGIGNRGTLTVTNSTISGNGGGIYSIRGVTTVTNSTISGNNVGIYSVGGVTTVTNSTISGNTSTGISNSAISTGTLTVTNSTISGNSFSGIDSFASFGSVGVATVTNSTISRNWFHGIRHSGVLTVANTIVAINSPNNCQGEPTSNGNNLDDDGTCGFTQPSDLSNVADPSLGPLANNGGLTQTHALLLGSPAIDAADPIDCLPFDQRGQPRADGDGDSLVICDIGAFEASEGPCGNGIFNLGEECDDGNVTAGDGCNASCQCDSMCGDGQLNPNAQCGEECDDGNNIDGDGCNSDCGMEFCGDGVVNDAPNEQCDDGNNVGRDGCSSTCQVEPPGQNEDQQRCINQLNKGFAKVAKAQGRENARCIRAAGKGSVASAEACLTADARGKVAKAKNKNSRGEIKRCTGFTPDFGSTDSATGNQVGMDKELDLLADVFGSDLDPAIIDADDDRAGAKCQAATIKQVSKCSDAKLKVFNECKKNALRGGANTAADLEDCMDLAAVRSARKLSGPPVRACITDLTTKLFKACSTTDIATAFPGDCSSAVDLSGDLITCLNRLVECRVCLALNEVDNLARDCDGFDDGVSNGSCPLPTLTPCGPSGLSCDPANEICVSMTPIGPGTTYSCEPIPGGCEQDRSCACASSALCTGAFALCTDIAPNSLQCECPQCQ